MNDRFKDLLKKAAIHAQENTNSEHSDTDKDLVFMNKFAELIVADCVKIIEGYCETSPEIYGLPLEILDHFDMEIKDE